MTGGVWRDEGRLPVEELNRAMATCSADSQAAAGPAPAASRYFPDEQAVGHGLLLRG
jgi:hypothetical protein